MTLPEMQWFRENAAARALAALAQHNINGVYVSDGAQARAIIAEKLNDKGNIGLGGSRTLEELGILDMLRNGEYDLLDQYASGLTREDQLRLRREGTQASWFVSGVNAISETGELVFVDGSCNRVAGVLYDAGKLILVAGTNKICPDLSSALWRAKHIAAPTNAKRLNTGTPCNEDGICHDCTHERRICNATVIIHRQNNPERIFLVLVGKELGL